MGTTPNINLVYPDPDDQNRADMYLKALAEGVDAFLASLLAAGIDTSMIQGNAITSGLIAPDAIDNTKIRNSTALSVIGRSANSSGDPADIAAGTDGHVLRRSGTSLGFGTIATAGIGDSQVTNQKIATAPGGTIAAGTIFYRRLSNIVFVFTNGGYDHTSVGGNVLPAGYRPAVQISSSAIVFQGSYNPAVVTVTTGGTLTVSTGSGASSNSYFSMMYDAA